MKRAVAVSPRPGDAALSCGATLAGLAAGGWHVTLVTVFAASSDADRRAAEVLGLAEVLTLGVGTGSPASVVAAQLGPVLDAALPDRVFAPRGIDEHPDRIAVVAALRVLDHPAPVVRWRDTPHALELPATPPLPDERGIPVGPLLGRKLDACAAYDAGELREALVAFAEAEGRRLGAGGPAESLVEPVRDTRKRRPGQEEDDKAALVRALRGGTGLTR